MRPSCLWVKQFNCKSEGKFVRQSGGKGQYDHPSWKSPGEPGEAPVLSMAALFLKEYIAPMERGVKEAMENGVVAGYPMVDIAVTVYDTLLS